MGRDRDVVFKPKQVAEGDWQIEAHCPGAEIRYINGFKSEAEVQAWLAGSHWHVWLAEHGYADD
jgi:hypothetical protein